MEMCRIEGWGTRQLEERIDSMLYERTAISRKPDELIQLELNRINFTLQLQKPEHDIKNKSQALNYTNTYSCSFPTP